MSLPQTLQLFSSAAAAAAVAFQPAGLNLYLRAQFFWV